MSEKISSARLEKESVIEEIKAKIQKAASFVVVDYKGITVAQDTALRAIYRKAGIEYKVLKNRLFAIALKELGYSDKFAKHLEGPSAFAFGYEDAVAPAKAICDSLKKFNKLSIKCGMVDGSYIDNVGVENLSKLPSKEVLLSILLGTLQAPIAGLARALNGTITGLARVLQAVADQK